MSKIILDFGSGNTCKNDRSYIKRMYDELKTVDTGKHQIIVKWQLFEKAGNNIPLFPDNFEYAYDYGTSLGYKVTSSVFDKNSLDFLLNFDIPFVKIANNPKVRWLIDNIPTEIPIVASVGSSTEGINAEYILCCVSNYPANVFDYIKEYYSDQLKRGISDHTTTFELFKSFHPDIVEWHYKLSDSTGPDSGSFARIPEQLKEVL